MTRRAPLSGLRIVDAVDGGLASATRYLAELGAQVVHVAEHPAPAATARAGLRALAAHANKQWTVIPENDASLAELVGTADAIVYERSNPLSERILSAAKHAAVPQALVACSDFGYGNPLSDWVATDLVLHALSGELSRSGIRGREPLPPPGDLAFECAATQLAYVTLVAIFQAMQSRRTEQVDFSALDGAMQALDPGYGIAGSATMGRPARLLAPGRPAKGFQYPIFACADGSVRICLLAVRQWRGMFEWMGRPAEFASPEFDSVLTRYASQTLIPAIGCFFATQTVAELAAGADRHGVPLAAVLSAQRALSADHFAERATFAPHEGAFGSVMLPDGLLEIDGHRMNGNRDPAEAACPEGQPAPPAPAKANLPLSGLKVIDLGVIVVGGEQSRLLADLGADVIKVESRAFPDGTRQTELKIGMSVSFAAGHRNKRSIGLNLRSEEGKAVFERLVEQADVVLSNFKPGTLESLGLGYEALRTSKPDIVLVESSAFGPTGPWAKRMGYGPLVRAATGLTQQWRYVDDPEGFCDSVTIYPDHVGARVSVLGVLALLLDRARSGQGGRVTSAQAEIVLAHQAWRIAARDIETVDPEEPDDVPWGVFSAAGDDQWCVVTVRNQREWERLCDIVDGLDRRATREQRLSDRAAIEQAVQAWLAPREADEAAQILQAAGIPAAPMLRVAHLPSFRYFAHRNVFRTEHHPWLDEAFNVEAAHAQFAHVADPGDRPAPLAGENSEEILRDWLGLGAEKLKPLIESGAIEPLQPDILQALDQIRAGRASQESV